METVKRTMNTTKKSSNSPNNISYRQTVSNKSSLNINKQKLNKINFQVSGKTVICINTTSDGTDTTGGEGPV